MAVVAQGGGVVGVEADVVVAAGKVVAALQAAAFGFVLFAAALAPVACAGADVVGKGGIGGGAGKFFKHFFAFVI